MPAEKDAETGLPTLWRYGRRQSGNAPRARGRKSEAGGDRQPSRSPRPEKGARKKPHRKSAARHEKKIDPDSPFAALAALVPAKQPKKPQAAKPHKAEEKAPDTKPLDAPEALSENTPDTRPAE